MDSCNRPTSIPEGLSLFRDPFAETSQIRVLGLSEDGRAWGELTVTPESLNPHGMVHGGCLSTLADAVTGWGVYTATRRHCVTASCSLSFLRPARGDREKIFCDAIPEKLGHKLCVYRAIISDDAGSTLATGTYTFFLMEDPDTEPAAPA